MSLIQSGSLSSSNNLIKDEGLQVTSNFPKDRTSLNQRNHYIFKDPLRVESKKALENTFLFDALIRSAVQLNSWVTIQYPHKYQLYPAVKGQEEYNTDEEIHKAISRDTDLKKNEQLQLLKYIETVVHITDFEDWLLAYWQDAQIGGRSAFYIETLRNEKKNFMKDVDLYSGTPILFKPLHWKFLDQTYIDLDTFRIREVRYTDPNMYLDLLTNKERPDYFPIENLIYLTCDDSNAKENSFGYGNSRLYGLVNLSAARRQCTDKDVPELFHSFWNQSGVYETDDTSEENLEYLKKNLFAPGGIAIVKTQNGKFTPVALKHDGWFMIQYLGLARQEILRMFRIPDFLLNYTSDSRSVIETSVNIWSKFVIDPEREQIFKQVYPQFFKKLVQLWLQNNGKDANIANALTVRPIYKKISIEDLLSKANSLELLIRRDVITKRESRNFIDLPEKRIEDKQEDMKLTALQWASLSERERIILMETEAKKMLQKDPPKANPNKAVPDNQQEDIELDEETESEQKQTDAEKNPGRKQPVTRANAKPVSGRGAGRGNSVG